MKIIISILLSCLVVWGFSNLDTSVSSYAGVTTVAAVGTPPPAAALSSPKDWPTQIRESLIRNGFTPEQARIMLAIGVKESGLRLEAIGDVSLQNSKWGPSISLFQIRTLKREKGSGSCRDIDALKNGGLEFNSKCAYEISGRGSNFKPWSVYLSGSYKSALRP